MMNGITPAIAPAHTSQPILTGPGTYGSTLLAASAASELPEKPARQPGWHALSEQSLQTAG